MGKIWNIRNYSCGCILGQLQLLNGYKLPIEYIARVQIVGDDRVIEEKGFSVQEGTQLAHKMVMATTSLQHISASEQLIYSTSIFF